MADHALAQTFDLVRQAQNGEREALDDLFARYYERVQRVVRVRVGAGLRRRLESGDVLQRTFLKAFEIFDRFEMRDESSLMNWLATLAERQIHELVEHHGRDKRAAARERSLDAAEASAALAGAGSVADTARLRPDNLAALDEHQRRLETALDELPAAQRELIVMREYLGMSWQQVAAESGRSSPDAARVACSAAMAALTIKMRQLGG